MRAFRLLNLAILSILVASSAALYAQDEKQQEEKPRQEEPKRQAEPKKQEEARPAGKQDEMKPPHQQEEAKPQKQGRQEPKQEQKEENRQGREMKPGQPQNEQHADHARPAGKSAHIPEEKFHAQFGREHHFAVQRPIIVEGSPGFFYGGYSFVLIDPWPAEWAYADDCYIDYVDGEYFLFDVFHPGVRIALVVVE